MEQHVFWHPGTLELCILLQTLLYLITFPILFVSLKCSSSLNYLVFSLLKVFYLNFFAHSVVQTVNRMMQLPYQESTKRPDNAKTPFSNLKLEHEKWMKNRNISKTDMTVVFEKWRFLGHFSCCFFVCF